MVLDELYQKTEDHMKKTLEMLSHELGGIRTGKASPALLDSLRVNYYGSMVPVKQVANVAVPDARLITIQPWDRGLMHEIEKAISSSELGLNPQNDGTLIRLPIPPLTEERRKELVKVVKRIGEDSKVAVRNVRRDANEKIKKLQKEHELSEDAMHQKQEAIQKLTDQFVHKVDEAIAAKEKEILEI
ncbi:MAG TPA: ribosome recycling factor [Candidatus Krumholzibacteria bacterium]|nr:ribosome recycling factor [Candidatus Krumholzibacteria bacterium]